MSLPVTVPFTFGNATTTQSLSSLDTNFTTITNSVNGLTNGASQINVASISATGTANATTYLRGDGAWATVSGGGGGGSNISNGTSNVAITSSNGNVTAYTNGNLAMTIDSNLNTTFRGTAVMASSFLRNRLINGAMQIAQRGTSATVTAGTGVPTASTGYPCVDRWFVYSTGANVTAAQVAGTGNNKNLLQVTGAASVTAVGIGQRIEQLNSYDLAGQTCTLSVNIANSLLTTVTWTASYATTTADTFGTIGTPTKTQIATGTFTVTSTLTQYTASIAVPAAATTGIEILFTVGAQISGTWQVGNAQLEAGSVATPFERRQYGEELILCQRYYEKSYNNSVAVPTAVTSGTGQLFVNAIAGGATVIGVNFAVSKRTSPTVVAYDNAGTSGKNTYYTTGWINGGTATINTALEKGFNATLGGTGTLLYLNADWAASAEL